MILRINNVTLCKHHRMKSFLFVVMTLLFCSSPSSLLAQEHRFIEDFVERLENSKKYILLLAETMPEVL